MTLGSWTQLERKGAKRRKRARKRSPGRRVRTKVTKVVTVVAPHTENPPKETVGSFIGCGHRRFRKHRLLFVTKAFVIYHIRHRFTGPPAPITARVHSRPRSVSRLLQKRALRVGKRSIMLINLVRDSLSFVYSVVTLRGVECTLAMICTGGPVK